MLEHNPILRDRLMALATFCGIAIAGVSGFEMVIGGALPSIGLSAPVERRGGEMIQADMPWWSSGDVTQTNYMPGDAAYAQPIAVTDERLAGAADDETAPDHPYLETDEALIRDAIATLYTQSGEDIAADYQSAQETAPAQPDYRTADYRADESANGGFNDAVYLSDDSALRLDPKEPEPESEPEIY